MEPVATTNSLERPNIDVVARIRAMMANAAGKMPDSADQLRSIFLIGSCSGPQIPDERYQDYDVHFAFQGFALRDETLEWFRLLLDDCMALSDDRVRVETFVKDRHWKMVPDDSVSGNVGVHATILNTADHFRRLHHNPVLASNMYVRCGVVHGEHPARMRGWRSPTPLEQLHSVGGVAWMAENFARAVALYLIDQTDHTFYPYICGYAWNAASSVLFHLYTAETGGIIGRDGALRWFLNLDGVPREVREAAEFVYEHRCSSCCAPDLARDAINAAGWVVHHAGHRVAALRSGPLKFTGPQAGGVVLDERTMFAGVPERLGVTQDAFPVVDAWVDVDERDYSGSVTAALDIVRSEFGEQVSVKEHFEFLRDVEATGQSLVRVHLWDSLSYPRRLLSNDYAHARGAVTEASAVFGWEDGCQALLQRLHELLLERDATVEPAARDRLAGAAMHIAAHNLRALGVTPPFSPVDDITVARRALGTVLAQYVSS